jgi:diguanylate cyclase (GGDEF)-like protein/PAS domain S-box-containing protein
MNQYFARLLALLRQQVPTLLVLGCALVLTLAAWRAASQLEAARHQTIFVEIAQAHIQKLEQRMHTDVRLLQDLRGLYAASNSVTATEFSRYLQQTRVQQDAPEIRRFGYAPMVTAGARAGFEARMQQAALPDQAPFKNYRVWPPGRRSVYFPVAYQFPISPAARNLPYGFDESSEAVRWQAMALARDLDQPVKTGRIRAVYGRPGFSFLIYAPVYKRGDPVNTIAERRHALAGFVFAVFNTHEMMQEIFGPGFLRDIDIDVYDGLAPNASKLLYDHDVGGMQGSRIPHFEYLQVLNFANRPWTVVFRSTPAFDKSNESHMPAVVLAGGLAASLLLAGIANLYFQKRRRTLETLQRDVEFRSLFNQNTDAIVAFDLDGRLVRANEAAVTLFSLSVDERAGISFRRYLAPEDRERVLLQFEAAKKGSAQDGQTRIVTHNGNFTLSYKFVPTVVAGQVTGIFVLAKDISEQLQKERQLAYLAQYDTLTGLPNRALILDRLNHAIARARRERHKLALMFLDLDKFKDINDSLGHAAGDIVLKTIAERLRTCLRAEDTVARLGGDEFTVLLESVPDEAHALVVAQKIIDVIAAPLHVERHEVFTSTSIGLVFYPTDAVTAEEMMKAADMAMYQAKSQGRNNYQVFSRDMLERATTEIGLKAQLAHAIQRKELQLFYQPQYEADTGQIVGVEALMRWNHPALGLLSPDHFIHLAEDTGLITPIGQWALSAACQQNKKWQEQGLKPMRIAVNISARQFRDPQFVHMVERILADTGLAAQYLELEITESLLMENIENSEKILQSLKALGIQITIDDFGTGYSSLSYLANFPLDVLKIDRSFVKNMVNSSTDASITEAIISLAHTLNLKIIAEGVETWEQIEFLKKRKAQTLQGYYFSRPVPADRIADMLKPETEPHQA